MQFIGTASQPAVGATNYALSCVKPALLPVRLPEGRLDREARVPRFGSECMLLAAALLVCSTLHQACLTVISSKLLQLQHFKPEEREALAS